MDGAPLRTISIAQQKAYTAVRMGSSTEAFLERLRRSRWRWPISATPGSRPCPAGARSGTPQGLILGAVGVSGLKPSEDQALADQLAGTF